MVNGTNLRNLIKREKEHVDGLEVGSEGYVDSMHRLMELEKQLSEIEKNEAEMELAKKSRKNGNVIEWAKIGANVALPLIGFVTIVAAEKDITFTGALRDITKSFLPKKMS